MIVIDTSTILQALLAPDSSAAQIIARWQDQDLHIATSPALLGELAKAMTEKPISELLQPLTSQTKFFVDRFEQMAFVIETVDPLVGLAPHLANNPALQCAVNSGARYIVTLDEQLLELYSYRDILMLSPNTFMTALDQILSDSVFQ